METELSWPSVLLSDEFKRKAQTSRVLVVGAGGIGSEVLKTLVLTGFKKISLIDLDTIEISNLNRQFLFRSSHVGQSKAFVASEAVIQFLPPSSAESLPSRPLKRQKSSSNAPSSPIRPISSTSEDSPAIDPFYTDICDPSFGVDFYRGFDIVLNGLDNLKARRHVNRLCLAAEIPLVESGTAGYEGSVTVHIKGHSHCYECSEKPVPKSYPICTIRNTPDKLIHCVVWAKDLLFPRLFGDPSATTDLDDEASKEEGGPSFFVRKEEEDVRSYALRIFYRVFDLDIRTVSAMKDLWTKRKPPNPIKWPFGEAGGIPSGSEEQRDIYKVLSIEESAILFVESIIELHRLRPESIGKQQFDKDDRLAVNFVAASANLRASCYSISPSSIFEIKGIAGNIIHAIATTNAIVAGLLVTEACKILTGCRRFCKETFVGKHSVFGEARRKRDVLIKSTMPPEKNPSCLVCGKAIATVLLDTTEMTLDKFLSKVVKERMGVASPTLVCDGFMYEEGEGLEAEEKEEYNSLLPKVLAELPGKGILDGSIVMVESQAQQLSCKLVVSQKEDIDENLYPDLFILQGEIEGNIAEAKSGKRKRESETEDGGEVVVVTSDEDCEILDD